MNVTGLIRSQLFGLQPNDPLTFISASMLMVAVAVLAAWIPARQASRVAPVLALKSE